VKKRRLERFALSRKPIFLAAMVLLLALGLFPLVTMPAEGRWTVPSTIPPSPSGHSPKLAQPPIPTPTPIPLPESADVPILMYHYVSELPADADEYRRDLTVTPANFEAQMDYLAEADYHPITLTDLHLHLSQGYPLPEKPVVLSFDDGYRDAYEVVFPHLLERGFTAVFFVLASPAHIESADYLTWTQMKEMSDAGMSIQAHGRDHVDLRDRDYAYLVYQLVGIKEAIEYHTGQIPRFFCYPAGQYDADVITVLESADYWGAVTTQWGREHRLENRYELTRLRIRHSDTLESFVSKLEE